MNDDIQEVRAMLAPANPCPPGSLAGARRDATGRAALAQVTAAGTDTRPAARRGFSSRRASVRLVAVGGLAVAIATGATVVQNLGGIDENGNPRQVVPGLPAGPVANAQEVLRKAADAAQQSPPRPDQWLFRQIWSRQIDGAADQVWTPESRLKTATIQNWTRVDGKQTAFFKNGKLAISNEAMPIWLRDLDALLAEIREQPPGENGGHAFDEFLSILANGVLTPAQEAAIYRAVAKIPGVELNRRAVDGRGHPALAVSFVEDWRKLEILLDPDTYAFRGVRSTAVKDWHPVKAARFEIKKGAIETEGVVLAAGYVDRPGQRP